MKNYSLKKIIALAFLAFVALHSCSKDDVSNTDNDIDNGHAANQQPVGTSANDLLSDAFFTSMVIEIAYVDGFAPTQTAIDNFVAFLESRTFKPNGILVVTKQLPTPGNSTYTIQDILAIEEANRTQYNTNNQIAVWAFFADGESATNSGNNIILGTAYRNTSFVIFEETIQSLTGGTFEPDRDVVETTVITHEFGHILGLTNLGSPMQTQHEDADHPRHCNVETCLMYWTTETGSAMGDLMGTSSAPQLDAQCIADLQANGGK